MSAKKTISRERVQLLLEKARVANKRAEAAERAVFSYLEDHEVDIDRPGHYCNADRLEDAISCFIQYDEENAEKLSRIIVGEVES
jgi:hypothetical protein